MPDDAAIGRSGKAMRRDAKARREALIVAAADCFARSGYLVPLEDIAERAGVGRGTLYRNFTDRLALAIAVFDRELDRLERVLDASLPLDRMIADIALTATQTAALFHRLAVDMPLGGEKLAAFTRLGERFSAMLAPSVDRAHAQGTLHPDIGAHEVALVVRMVGNLLLPHYSPAEMRAIVDEAIPLVMRGLLPR